MDHRKPLDFTSSFTSYEEALTWLYGLSPRGIQLGLERMKQACQSFENPQQAFPSIHVAGTNGKGSTCAMLASMGIEAGYNVGLYTSPHLHQFTERIQTAGSPVSKTEVLLQLEQIKNYLDRPASPALTFFEVTTLLAFLLFREKQCDWVVLETGLGGRLDATNVVVPLMSILTSISMDHKDRLGHTIAEIAREKAGIIKKNVPVISSRQRPDALQEIQKTAAALGAPFQCAGQDFSVQDQTLSQTERHDLYSFRSEHIHLDSLSLPLSGSHQTDNAACAIFAATQMGLYGFSIDEQAIRLGLQKTQWPGRLEWIKRNDAPDLLFDCAHNPDAAQQLALYLKTLPYKTVTLVFASMKDKPWEKILEILEPHVSRMHFTKVPLERSLPLESFHTYQASQIADPIEAFERACAETSSPELVLVTGSIFLVSAIRSHVLQIANDPLIPM